MRQAHLLCLQPQLLVSEYLHDVWPALRKTPDEVVVSLQVGAEVALEILPHSDVERRAEVTRPELEVADLVPAEALPRRQIDQRQVSMEGDEIDDEQLEEHVDDERHPAKDHVLLGKPEREEHRHHKLGLLQPQVSVEVSPVSLTDAVTEPRTVVVVRPDALLTHTAVSCPHRYVNVADIAVAQSILNFACAVAPLDRRQRLIILVVAWLAVAVRPFERVASRLHLAGVLH